VSEVLQMDTRTEFQADGPATENARSTEKKKFQSKTYSPFGRHAVQAKEVVTTLK